MEERDFITDCGDHDINAVYNENYIIGFDHVNADEFAIEANKLVRFYELPDDTYTFEDILWEYIDSIDEDNIFVQGTEQAVTLIERF